MIVDGHAHVFAAAPARRRARKPADDTPTERELVPPGRDAPVEGLLELMAANGVGQAVLVALDGSWRADQAVADAVDRHPGRFASVAVAGGDELGWTSGNPVDALRERRAEFPFDALRTSWLGTPSRPLADSPALPVLGALAEAGMPLWSYLPPGQFGLLEQLVTALPDLPVALNHLGFCPHDMRVDEHLRPRFHDPFPASLVEKLLRLADAPNVYLMVSGQYALSTGSPPYPDLFEPTRKLAAAFGPDRLLWGSDHPWPSQVPGYPELLGLVDAALPDLTPAGRDELLGGTARRLFPTLRRS